MAEIGLVEQHAQLFQSSFPASYIVEFDTFHDRSPSANLMQSWRDTINSELPAASEVRRSEIIANALSLWDATNLTFISLKMQSKNVYNIEYLQQKISWDGDSKEFTLWDDHRRYIQNEREFWRVWYSNESYLRMEPAQDPFMLVEIRPHVSNIGILFDGGTIHQILKGATNLELAEEVADEIIITGRYQAPTGEVSNVWFAFSPAEQDSPSMTEAGLYGETADVSEPRGFAIWSIDEWLHAMNNGQPLFRPRNVLIRSGTTQLSANGIDAVHAVRATAPQRQSGSRILHFEANPRFDQREFQFSPPPDAHYTVVEDGESRFVRSEIEQLAIDAGAARAQERRQAIVDQARVHQGFPYIRWFLYAGGSLLVLALLWRILRKG